MEIFIPNVPSTNTVCEYFDVRCKRHLPENSDRFPVRFYNCSATWQMINNSTRFTSHIGTNSLPTVTLLPFAQKNIWKSDLHYTGLTSLCTSKMIPFAHRLVNWAHTTKSRAGGRLQAQYRHPLQPSPPPQKKNTFLFFTWFIDPKALKNLRLSSLINSCICYGSCMRRMANIWVRHAR